MPKILNIFAQYPVMDKDTSEDFIKGIRHSENMRFTTNDGDDGIGVNIKGTKKISDSTEAREDLKCVTALYDKNTRVILYFLASESGLFSKVVEYNVDTEATEDILHDTRGVLNLDINGFITGINEIDGLVFFSEWGNNPRRFNTERARGYTIDGFEEEDIMVALVPPNDKPKVTLSLTDSEEENYLEEKIFYFAYRWRYLDGEYSKLSPFSNPAFHPKKFNYDFSEQSNRSMVNKFNKANIEFNTGSYRVTEIQLILKESQSNSEFIIDDFVKTKMGWGDNEAKSFDFINNKRLRALSDTVIRDYSSGVPLTVKAQTIIDGRLIYGNYLENFDLVDEEGDKINLEYTVELIAKPNVTNDITGIGKLVLNGVNHNTLGSTLTLTYSDWQPYFFKINDPITIPNTNENGGAYTITSVSETELVLNKNEAPLPVFNGVESETILFFLEYEKGTLIPKKTVKSIIDYEVGVIYEDGFGRTTVVLASKTNTINVPAKNSITENALQVIIPKEVVAPNFAKYYRFFIKPSKKEYDQILPTLFYEDGVYRWIKIEGADKDKVKEGDYLIIKRDSKGLLKNLVKTKVLEVKSQDQDFLHPTNETDFFKEKSGLYFKIRPRNFRLDLIDFNSFKYESVFANRISSSTPYIDNPHFYGETLNDLSSSGSYTGGVDEKNRYLIEIDGVGTGTGGVDTFRWSEDDGVTIGGFEIDITGANQLLNKGVEVIFNNTTGHSIFDKWNINARGGFLNNEYQSGFFKIELQDGESLTNESQEIIRNGSRIDLSYYPYYDSSDQSAKFSISNTSSDTYDNIQEWFIKEGILNEIISQNDLYSASSFRFVKGRTQRYSDNTSSGKLEIVQDINNGITTLIVDHPLPEIFAQDYIGETNILSSGDENIIIFETEAKDTPPENWYEIGKTYPIVDGYHQADTVLFPDDVTQNSTNDLKVTLDWFNAFSYGNGVESYKIKDEFNRKGLETGIRVLTTIKDEYKQVHRESDVTWSDVYEKEFSFNGLSTFNNSLTNWVKLDKEDSSIQKLHNFGRNLLVFQEDAVGLLPYNKSIIYDVEGGSTVGITTNILDKNSYAPYGSGKYGISKNPESFEQVGSRFYFTDQSRGNLLQLANNGITEINQNGLEYEFSKLMRQNGLNPLIGGYDPKTKEYLLYVSGNKLAIIGGQTPNTLSYKENNNGFPTFYSYAPDFMLYANNELYSWKKGVMYRHNATELRNNFYGVQYVSKLKFHVNQEFSVEKIFMALGLQSTHAWLANLKTKLTSKSIPKEHFEKIEDYWYSEIMGNTNNNTQSNPVFGIGSYAINNGVIEVQNIPNSLSIGDIVLSANLIFNENKIIDVQENKIFLQTPITAVESILMYKKNLNIDGGEIRGSVLEVELINNETVKSTIRATSVEVVKSYNS